MRLVRGSMRVKEWVAKRRATCEPIMGPEPTTKRGPGEDIVRVGWKDLMGAKDMIGEDLLESLFTQLDPEKA